MNEHIIQSINANTRFAILNWKADAGPYWVSCLDYADIVQVKRFEREARATQYGWRWVNKGDIVDNKQTLAET